jgi:outer membrane protein assembly factor BamB
MESYSYGARESVAYACNGDIILNGPVGSVMSTMRLDKDNGEVVWTNNNLYAVGPVRGLAATGSRVYRIKGAINQPIQLLAIDIETGASLYSTPGLPGDGDQENPIAVGNDGRIYFWRDNGALYSFTDTGSGFVQNWSFQPLSSHHGGGKRAAGSRLEQ